MNYYQLDTFTGDRKRHVFVDSIPPPLMDQLDVARRAERLGNQWPSNATLRISGNYPGSLLRQILPTDQSLIMAAPHSAELLVNANPASESLPFTLRDHRGRAMGKDLAIVNLFRTFDCIDLSQSEVLYSADGKRILMVGDCSQEDADITLSASKLKSAPLFFRAKYATNRFFIAEPLLKELEKLEKPIHVYQLNIK